MNAFYERLALFGASIAQVSEHWDRPVEELFTVVHPGHPIVSHERSTRPSIHFEQDCPIPVRRKVRQLLRKTFASRKLVPVIQDRK